MFSVLFYSELIDYGGVENMIRSWTMNLSCVKFDILTRKIINHQLVEVLNSYGCNVYEIKCKKYDYITRYRFADNLMKKKKYDIVHLHSMFALEFWFCDVARKNGIPIRIAHSHNAVVFKKPTTYLIDRISKPFLRSAATEYFGCSRDAIISLFGDKDSVLDKAIVVKNCVDNNKFLFNSNYRNKIREMFNIDNRDILLGTVGRISKQKNYRYLLHIFKCLYKKHKNYKLMIVGDGEEKEKLLRLSKQYQLPVIFTGTRNDVNQLLCAMDVFVLTSLFEGFPVVALEAQATGLPICVSSAIPSEALILPESKRVGSFDDEDWISQLLMMKKLKNDKRINYNSIIEKNRFTEIQCCNDLLQIYLKLLARNDK